MITGTCAEMFRYFTPAGAPRSRHRPRRQQTGGIMGAFTNMHAYTLKEPYGVVG